MSKKKNDGKKRKTIRKVGVEPYQSHRNDFRTCPHCDHHMEHEAWDKAAHTVVLEPRCQKPGSVSLITECPKCFEDSWIHKPMTCFEYTDFPKKWKVAVAKKEAALKLQALRDWAFSLCGKCTKLEEGKVEYYAWSKCDGRSGSVETECDRFVALKKGNLK